MFPRTPNPALINGLIASTRDHLWSTPGGTIYYSFDPGSYGTRYPHEFRRQNLSATFQEIIHSVIREISQAVGIAFTYRPRLIAGDQNQLFITASRGAVSEEGVHFYGTTQSIMTNDGSPNTPASLKRIVLFQDLENQVGPTYTRWVMMHELFHALGLDHPEAGFFSSPYTASDSIMARVSPDIEQCYLLANTREQKEKCGEQLPTPFYSAEDILAVREQRKSEKNASYVSPYKSAQSPTFFNATLSTALVSGGKAFISSFIKTFIQGYLKPYLIERAHFNNQRANALAYAAEVITDACLYSLPNLVVGKVISFILSTVLKQFKVANFSTVLAPLETALMSLLDAQTLTNALASTPGAALGTSAAWNVIRNLPRIHPEPTMQPAKQSSVAHPTTTATPELKRRRS